MINYLEEYLTKRNPLWVAIFLFILAFILRFYMVFANEVIVHDGILYINMAKIIDSGNLEKISEFGFFNLYPLLIVLSQKIFRDWELAGRMVSTVLGSVTIVPLFFLIRKMINVKVAIIASLFYMIGPRFVEYSSDVLRESTFWFFSITALWLAWEGISGKRWFLLVLSSIFTGLSIFTRMEGISIFFIIAVWIFWYFRETGDSLKRAFLFLLILIISLPVMISPSLFVLKDKLGKWEFGQVGEYLEDKNLLIYGTGRLLEVKPDILNKTSTQFQTFLDVAKRHKYTIFFSEMVYKILKSFHIVLFIFFLFGIFRRRVIPYSRNEIPVFIWFMVFFLTSFFYMTKKYYFGTRHGLLMGFPMLIWSGIGFYELKDRIEKWTSKTKLFFGVSKHSTTLLIFIILILILPQTLSSNRGDKIELKKAGIYLKDMGYSKVRFVGEPILHRAIFYSDSEFISLPPGLNFEEVVKFLRENQTRFLIIDKRTVDAFLHNFNKNVDPLILEKVQLPKLDQFKEYSIVVYRLKKE
jgi:4-amino-4-deoxy-L-arabinose transferase-like glycosyltransferase